MNVPKRFKLTAAMLVLEAILAIIPFLILQKVFEFPDILRKPASEVLQLFQDNKSVIVAAYYFFMLSGLLLIPLAIAIHQTVKESVRASSFLLAITTAFGVSAGITQIIGFIRWPFLVPYLSDTYLDPASSTATKEAIVVVYESLNRYAGMAIGEHLGFVFLGLWIVGFSMIQLQSPIFKKWLGWIGVITGVCLTISSFEQISGNFASALAALNIAANSIFMGWLVITAVFLLRKKV